MGRITPIVLGMLLLVACGGKHSETELLIFNWGQALNTHLATGSEYNEYPHSLDEIDEAMRSILSMEDSWGTKLHYRRMRDDKYQLISAGPNGTLGDDDDIVSANGKLQDPLEIYAENPIKKGG